MDSKLKIIDDLNSRRALLNMSQQDLADAAFMSKSTVSRALDPEKGNPKIRDVVAMAKAMGADLTIMTPETKLALENSDVTFYREAIIKAEGQIENLTQQNDNRQQVIDHLKAKVASAEEKLENEQKWNRRLVRLFSGVILSFLVVIAFLVVIDLANHDVGWFQHLASHFTGAAPSTTLSFSNFILTSF